MEYEIVKSSAELAAATEAKEMPLERLEVGQSFSVPFSDINENALRLIASRQGKKLNRKFKIKKWAEHSCFEVGRVA